GLAHDDAELAALRATAAEQAAAAPPPHDSALLAELEHALPRQADRDPAALGATRLRADLELGRQRLPPPLPRAHLPTVPLPRRAELDDHHARALDLERERRSAASELTREADELARSRAELATLSAGDLPDLEALPAARGRREEIWHEIRRRLSTQRSEERRVGKECIAR